MTEISANSFGTNSKAASTGEIGSKASSTPASSTNEALAESIATLLKNGRARQDAAGMQASQAQPQPEPEEIQDNGRDQDASAQDGSEAADRPTEAQTSAQPDDASPAAADEQGTRGADDPAQGRDEGQGPRSLRETAEALKVPAQQLYEMEVPLGRGEDGEALTMSVQQLKHAYLNSDAGQVAQERHDLAERQAAFEGRQVEREQEVIQARSELSQMAGLLQKHVPPQALRAALGTVREAQRREADALLEAMPRLREEGAFPAFRKDVVQAMSAFGFSEAEAMAVGDHRTYKMLDAFLRMQKRLKALDEAAKGEPQPLPRVVRPSRSGKAPKKGQKAVEAAKRPGASRDAKVKGVAALLSG